MATLYLARGEDGRQLAPALLTRLLAERYGVPTPEIARRAGGKPWFPARADLHFSLSHSGGLALCGVGGAELGVDVERLRPRADWLPHRLLSAEELAWYGARGSRWEDFYTLWTLKEALCKCTGEGLRRPVQSLVVPLLDREGAGTRDGFSFRCWGGPDWRAALCLTGRGAENTEIDLIS